MASVLLPLATGFEELEAVALIDVMRRGGIEVRVVYLEDELHSNLVTGANGITIQADMSIKTVISDDFDMMVLPGGWDGTYALAANKRIIELVKEFKSKKYIAAMCAAPYVLKKAEVLGDNYTCYPGAKEEIDHPGYTDKLKVVVDGNVITSQGPGTAVCFGLEILKTLVGTESMQAVKEGMLLDYC
ncbi:MAG: 4-methyl-5(beta-hydroxyethyl)-thiazole monophosphate synthesis protein [uncultured Sulfurovum sp.]|uniref:4-methyl-5(Beta-hydroxyethyl)-thiazole monophosphate synthesis protein n=1 Tax=uncultured Sulfurovum sp. TaxID=269237 RepID=A0A6S6SVW8_9BACT|nr:MAG: 4-methyl-5(beta-hydroxyethyl)-thiazole monophosphate synthesis protein [uncultured Sulfurovum sp.]